MTGRKNTTSCRRAVALNQVPETKNKLPPGQDHRGLGCVRLLIIRAILGAREICHSRATTSDPLTPL
ncbi:hypothetical protein CSUI_007604 [Cystoisospora suis]|uniref:Uncharacterized protein n=1 Tax=Cystoisospora suis TaxID=483139 RepID=A0A2C6KPM8_9APIC|nr:hypothetical protein CSUI_007604 [Cystoisospora suis]